MFASYGIILVNILLTVNYSLQDVKFKIIHTGDIHGKYKMAAKISTIIKHEKAKTRELPAIYLDTGDIFTGTTYFIVGGPKMAGEVMRKLNPDGMAVGNHEFDRDITGLIVYLKLIGQKLLCCNCDISNEASLKEYFEPSRVLNVANTEVGIVGYIYKDVHTRGHFGNVSFTNEKTSIEREVQHLSDRGIKIIILFGHGGYYLDQEIAKSTRNIDVIVGGHSHIFLNASADYSDHLTRSGDYPTLVKNLDGKEVPIVHAYCEGMFVGKLEVTLSNDGNLKKYIGSLIETEKSKEDADVMNVLSKYDDAIAHYLGETIGYSTVQISKEDCRRHECNLGNLVVDSFLDYYVRTFNQEGRREAWSNVGIGILNGGFLTADITENNQGKIKVGDMRTCFRNSNRIVLLAMKGLIFRQALEHSISWLVHSSRGEFLQFSGVRVIYDYSKPQGNRVASVRVRCGECPYPKYEFLNDTHTYNVVTTEYLAKGGSNFKMLHNYAKILDTAPHIDIEIVKQYTRGRKVLQPQREQRIIVTNDNRPRTDEEGSADGIHKANLYLIMSLTLKIITNRHFCLSYN